MNKELAYFEMFPKIVPADRESTVTIRSLFSHCMFEDDKDYEITHVPMERPLQPKDGSNGPVKRIKPVYGSLKFSLLFNGEQEHLISVHEVNRDEKRHVGDFYLYSLENDLYERYPYKGDFHMHSFRSDGRETPGYVAASCRKIGLDFMALTDHGQYAPSIEAQEAFKDLELDFKIFRGEEVHAPNNPLHIINFGGSFSINDLISKNPEKYAEEVKIIEGRILDAPQDMDSYQYASSEWVFNKIREAGGLGIYCHPYWVYYDLHNPEQGYYISSGLISYMFDKQPYDAFELLGGYYRHEANSNMLQVARYNEERAKGRKIPIVGVSDAHGCETGDLFGWYYTIVFSPGLDLQDIAESVKSLYSVAVEAIPGETARVHGPFRLVKYSLFLLREVFPVHDKLCFEEGSLMLQYESGNKNAAEKLTGLAGQVPEFLKKIMAKS